MDLLKHKVHTAYKVGRTPSPLPHTRSS